MKRLEITKVRVSREVMRHSVELNHLCSQFCNDTCDAIRFSRTTVTFCLSFPYAIRACASGIYPVNLLATIY